MITFYMNQVNYKVNLIHTKLVLTLAGITVLFYGVFNIGKIVKKCVSVHHKQCNLLILQLLLLFFVTQTLPANE